MKEYLFLFRGGDGQTLQQSPENWQIHMQKWGHWMGQLSEENKLLAAQPLTPTGRLVTGTNKVITDAPFLDGKQRVSGFLICSAHDYDEAVEISKGCPILEFDDGMVEVREVQELAP